MKNNVDKNFFFLNGINRFYIESIYKNFLNNPTSVSYEWKSLFNKVSFNFSDNKSGFVDEKKIFFVNNFLFSNHINNFRSYGHFKAKTDPLNIKKTKNIKKFFLDSNQLHENQYNKNSEVKFFYDHKDDTYSIDTIKRFEKIYCNSIGFEYMHIDNYEERTWVQEYIESKFIRQYFTEKEKKFFLDQIIKAEEVEHYLGRTFPGSKRFSLEGGDVIIPILKEAIYKSLIKYKIKKIILGMSHRGRLNVLVNIFNKKLQNLCNEFLGNYDFVKTSGDVKYHQGFCSNIKVEQETINLKLSFNPSHLEIVNPVVMGIVRANLDSLKDNEKNCILPITIHGDASVIGQGVIQETLNMSRTASNNIGGTIRIIINNQIGFTTDVSDSRSTNYCTDIFKITQCPILHVNGDNVHSAIFAINFALDFRNKFNKDVVIDLVCYRRHGHNEADEPSVTQPLMYKKIKKHPTLKKIYSDYLIKRNIISKKELSNMLSVFRNKLNNKYINKKVDIKNKFDNKNKIIKNNNIYKKNISSLKKLSKIICAIPSNLNAQSIVKKIFSQRLEMSKEKRLFDWGAAEILCYASLLENDFSIRICGEDVERGTFFHRHAVIYDQNNNTKYIPLHNIIEKNILKFQIYNSTLSEEASLAFEYGYSTVAKNTLVIWEAQFGDFANGAQVVIDQFISSGEQKWGQKSNIVMFLPHGYEGQGPEHSSARLERYLQLCAQNNIQVCIPSTPAQLYNLLFRQVVCNIKKPLIVLSPKSLLRHHLSTSSFEDIANFEFREVIIDQNNIKNLNEITIIILCSGKIFYDLISASKKHNISNTHIIRIEQLYPFPKSIIIETLNNYKNINKIIWCQEEPKNQGAWNWINYKIKDILSKEIELIYSGRPSSASTATGHFHIHQIEQEKIINSVFNIK
ncbi:sucA [Wigglesworthia glossinidia endosymbiont of Glossina brevipalpis]|uniref:oxoglutarate dehydrogenase (succinyl-transferring) n=1 Tax=Wigglesworthia glossinidia brevipalpis TaxID=36870 RepID=Q8D2D5_WIGBR|nr:sucA [Wigglesworthia glossinidia endosymbiont of Glossina brevipalpis]